MKAHLVIERLCSLQAEVQKHFGYKTAADCFCGGGGFGGDHVHSDHYRNDGEALEFIEKATRDALVRAGLETRTELPVGTAFASAKEQCDLICGKTYHGPCLADDCPRRAAVNRGVNTP
jgi:hypothetical protein